MRSSLKFAQGALLVLGFAALAGCQSFLPGTQRLAALEGLKARASLDCGIAERQIHGWPHPLGETGFFLIPILEAARDMPALLPIVDREGQVTARLQGGVDGWPRVFAVLDVSPDGALLIKDREKGGLLIAEFNRERGAVGALLRISNRLVADAKFAADGQKVVFYQAENAFVAALTRAGTDVRHGLWLWDRASGVASDLGLGESFWRLGPILTNGDHVAAQGQFYRRDPDSPTASIAIEGAPAWRRVHYFSASGAAPSEAQNWGQLVARAARGEGKGGDADKRRLEGVMRNGAVLVTSAKDDRFELYSLDGVRKIAPAPTRETVAFHTRFQIPYSGQVQFLNGADRFFFAAENQEGLFGYRLGADGELTTITPTLHVQCRDAASFDMSSLG